MRNVPIEMINAVDTTTQTGAPRFTGQYVAASFTSVFADATAVGVVKIQGSNEVPTGDPTTYVPSNASFSDITNATSTIASGVGPAIVIPSLTFQYIRAVYTSTSGGSSTVRVNGSLLAV